MTAESSTAAPHRPPAAAPAARRFYPGLEGLRGVLVLLVMAGHAGFPHNVFWIALPIFFVMSGFLITKIMLSAQRYGRLAGIKAFLVNRTLRLAPVYLLFVAGLTALAVVAGLGSVLVGEAVTSGFSDAEGIAHDDQAPVPGTLPEQSAMSRRHTVRSLCVHITVLASVTSHHAQPPRRFVPQAEHGLPQPQARRQFAEQRIRQFMRILRPLHARRDGGHRIAPFHLGFGLAALFFEAGEQTGQHQPHRPCQHLPGKHGQ